MMDKCPKCGAEPKGVWTLTAMDQWVCGTCQPIGHGVSEAHQCLRNQLANAMKYKTWTHDYLTKHGVPEDPDPQRNASTGCRMECRMDWLMDKLATVTSERDQYKTWWETSCQHVKESLELLGVDTSVDGYAPDSWTLREQCKMAGERMQKGGN